MCVDPIKILCLDLLKHLMWMFKVSLSLILLLPLFVNAKQSKASVSGFAHIVGGYLNEDTVTYQGYENSFSISPDSLIGLKGEYRFNENLAVVAQGIFTKSEQRKSGLDWLYISYKPTFNWQIDLGKFRTPFFYFSETIDVGFTYPWAIPPQSTYINALFSSIKGTRVTYLFKVDDVNFTLSGFGGGFHGDLLEDSRSLGGHIHLLTGVNLRLNAGNFKSRIGFVTGDFQINFDSLTQLQDTLIDFDFNQTARDLEIDGQVNSYQASAGYETLDYFILSEATLIDAESKIIAKFKSIYLTAGIYSNEITYYASLAALRTINSNINNGVPKGFSPQLDVLAFGVDNILANLIQDDVNIATFGVRWDIISTLAFKAEVNFINGRKNKRSTFRNIHGDNFDRKSNLYLFSIDWLF